MKCLRTILIVDDEEEIVEILQVYLRKEGYQVLCAYDGTTAAKLFKGNGASLISLDLMLPDIMGGQICRSIRTVPRVPITTLTARTGKTDLINGLQMGVDDYIFEPFSPRAMAVETGTVLRRAEGDELVSLSVSHDQGKLVIDFDNMIVRVQGKEIDLTSMELRILTTTTKAPNRTFTREQLIAYALNDDFDDYDRSTDAYTKGARLEIEDDCRYPSHTLMVHGLGYKFAGGME